MRLVRRLVPLLALVPTVALIAETVYGFVAITDLSQTGAWLLLVEVPTMVLAIFCLRAWVES